MSDKCLYRSDECCVKPSPCRLISSSRRCLTYRYSIKPVHRPAWVPVLPHSDLETRCVYLKLSMIAGTPFPGPSDMALNNLAGSKSLDDSGASQARRVVLCCTYCPTSYEFLGTCRSLTAQTVSQRLCRSDISDCSPSYSRVADTTVRAIQLWVVR